MSLLFEMMTFSRYKSQGALFVRTPPSDMIHVINGFYGIISIKTISTMQIKLKPKHKKAAMKLYLLPKSTIHI